MLPSRGLRLFFVGCKHVVTFRVFKGDLQPLKLVLVKIVGGGLLVAGSECLGLYVEDLLIAVVTAEASLRGIIRAFA